jgi:hypothetical protein
MHGVFHNPFVNPADTAAPADPALTPAAATPSASSAVPADTRVQTIQSSRPTALAPRFMVMRRCVHPATREIQTMSGTDIGNGRLRVEIDGLPVEMVSMPIHGEEGKMVYVPCSPRMLLGGADQEQATFSPRPGESSFDQIRVKVEQSVAMHFEQDMLAFKSLANQRGIKAEHRCIALVAHYARQVLREEHIPLHDPLATKVLKAAIDSAIREAEVWDNKSPFHENAFAVFVALRGHMSNLRAHEAIERTGSEKFGNTPIGKLAPEDRILMCVDPCKLLPLEEKTREIVAARDGAADDAGRNPFMGLIFDTESNYLANMLKGWEFFSESLRANVALSPDFITDFHATVANSVPFAGKPGVPANFYLFPEWNMTPAGRREVIDFVNRLKHDHGIDISCEPEEFMGKGVLGLKREAVEPELVKSLMKTWIDEYNVASASADDLPTQERSDQKVLAAIDLCQKLERFHVFKDGNCRLFGVLLLNYLLAKEGEPLTAIDNPNKLDGFSRLEMLQLLREGQALVRSLEQ